MEYLNIVQAVLRTCYVDQVSLELGDPLAFFCFLSARRHGLRPPNLCKHISFMAVCPLVNFYGMLVLIDNLYTYILRIKHNLLSCHI